MSGNWSDASTRYLNSTAVCPRCDEPLKGLDVCANCGAEVGGEAAVAVWAASRSAAEAIQYRQSLIDQLPVRARQPVISGPVAVPVRTPLQQPVFVAARETNSVSVPSVLAVAGAGLFAIAAFVFTFLNPDLTDFATRTVILSVTTALFLCGALLMARRSLRLSAEALGALGLVFLALIIWSASAEANGDISGYLFAGISLAVTGVAAVVVGSLVKLRVWLWGGLVGVSIAPALFGYATRNAWGTLIGHLVVALVALALQDLLVRLFVRFGHRLRTDRATLSTIQAIAMMVVPFQLFVVDAATPALRALSAVSVLAVIAAIAAASARHHVPRGWSFFAGLAAAAAFAAMPFGVLPFATDPIDSVNGAMALVPVAVAIALVALARLAHIGPLRRTPLLVGALAALSAVSLSALVRSAGDILSAGTRPDGSWTTVVGLAALTLGSLALPILAARRQVDRKPVAPNLLEVVRHLGIWAGVVTLLGAITVGTLPKVVQVGLALVIAFTFALAVVRVGRLARSSLALRVPILITAQVSLVLASVIAARETSITVATGVLVVGALFLVSRAIAPRFRLLYTAVGYAWALITLATALNLLKVDPIPLLCLVTVAAGLTALASTVTTVLRPASWYAVLIVTAVPFLIGIGSVVFERSGWTALSTAVILLLAISLVFTRREGLGRAVRAVASALLVPSLAVVIICLGAQVLPGSGSPITLPIIAVVIACVLPSTAALATAIERRGLSTQDARTICISLEFTTLVTAVIAVLLSLTRSAAGLGTTCLVLLIVGIGALVTGILARRRDAWVLAAISLTGALWSVWGLIGITVIEPYILPPASAGVVVGAILVIRGDRGRPLYTTALACVILPTLVVLAMSGSGVGAILPWRALGLLAASLLLIVVSAATQFSSARARIRGIARPSLVIAVFAAAGGAVEAARLGLSADPSSIGDARLVMLPVLGYTLPSAALAALAAYSLVTAACATSPASAFAHTRWAYAPAMALLVAGPITATRTAVLPITVLWLLMAGLLALMAVTAVRARTREVALPPVWLTFALAWATAVAGWSQRELRVEAFSLPLGLALLVVGVIALRAASAETVRAKSVNSWPIGYSGSWALLTPGLLVVLGTSILSTATDPLTIRAILVMALALAAVLLGSLYKLRAPFIIGIIVLPIENLVVFVVQVGRQIGAMPWWITLASVGAVLLVIAVTWERRTSGERGVSARIRDLR